MLEAIAESLRQAVRYNPSDAVAPVAILWTDSDGQWEPLIDELRALVPALYRLGEYDADTLTGPAIWLRCVIERTLPEIDVPEDAVPVIYMPGVSRQSLRVIEECPAALKPLVELQYRGTIWTQKNGRDWTVEAFLQSDDGGLGLDVAQDYRTRQAMHGSLSLLAVTPIARLRGKRLEAEDFDKLMIEDTTRDLLLWLNDPETIRAEWVDGKWAAFRSRCRDEYEFDPEADGPLVAGEKLGMHEGVWATVWSRFRESPALYGGMPDLLKRAKPSILIYDLEPWPDENEKAEAALRAALNKLDALSPQEVRRRIQSLDQEHGKRRDWVWASLGLAPLAAALEHLKNLMHCTDKVIGGDSPAMMAAEYIQSGYLADDAALQAMAAVKSAEDTAVLSTAVRMLYMDWIEASAKHLQGLLGKNPFQTLETAVPVEASAGQCLLFVDGLRFDLGIRLADVATKLGFDAIRNWRWAALPTVTGTAKPAVSPLLSLLAGNEADPDYVPEIKASGRKLTIDLFRKQLAQADYQVLSDAESGVPAGGRAWSECGEFDKLGHSLQGKLAAQVEVQIDLVIERIAQLLDAGWQSVRVVTDHGWLLLPGKLPVEKLPAYLAKTRWSRCAVIKETAHADCPVAPWFWRGDSSIAYANGIHSFLGGNEYAHGGISLQECVLPDLVFSRNSNTQSAQMEITQVQWVGQRCRVAIEPVVRGVTMDIRTKANDPDSSIVVPKEIDSEGKAALLVVNEDLAGMSAQVVVLDAQGYVLMKKPTTVGGDES